MKRLTTILLTCSFCAVFFIALERDSVSMNLAENASYFNKQPFGKSAIGSLMSDHEAFAVEIPLMGPKGSTKINLLSWNTWARGSRGGFDDNTPGFSLRKEPNADQRISNNFSQIKNFMNSNKNSLVCLQEISKADLVKLTSLGDNIVAQCSVTFGESFNNCILYKSTEFTPDAKISSDDIGVINNIKTHADANQKNRYQHLALINTQTLGAVDIINVHLKWHSDPDAIINALNTYLSTCKKTCIITGDFNKNLSEAQVAINQATKVVYEKGSVSATADKTRKENSTDAVVYKESK